MKIAFLGKMKFAAAVFIVVLSNLTMDAFADSGMLSFSLSPMKQSIVLNPGDTYHGSFKIVNPNFSDNNFEYEIERKSFYVDENYGTTFDGISSPIVDWTELDSPDSGVIAPNNNVDINFTINVPFDVASGGQYEAFLVKAKSVPVGDGSIKNGMAIREQLVMAHLVFVEVAGNTVRQCEFSGVDVPGFLLSGDIIGTASVKNTGNIHGTAKYKLQVFPLFSDEEIYTNEEDPDERIILPDRTLYNETVWDQTPEVGIFNVLYTVEFESMTAQVSKMVIKCPIWLLFIIIFVIFALVFYFVARARARKKAAKK